jgi:hypothetical protein
MRQNLFDSNSTGMRLLGKLMFASNDTLVGAGAASLETIVTMVESTGADVVTLADGVEGQIKVFIHEVDGGSAILTPATFAGASSATVTMLTAGDCVAFIFLNGSWWLLWATSNIEGTPLVIA